MADEAVQPDAAPDGADGGANVEKEGLQAAAPEGGGKQTKLWLQLVLLQVPGLLILLGLLFVIIRFAPAPEKYLVVSCAVGYEALSASLEYTWHGRAIWPHVPLSIVVIVGIIVAQLLSTQSDFLGGSDLPKLWEYIMIMFVPLWPLHLFREVLYEILVPNKKFPIGKRLLESLIGGIAYTIISASGTAFVFWSMAVCTTSSFPGLQKESLLGATIPMIFAPLVGKLMEVACIKGLGQVMAKMSGDAGLVNLQFALGLGFIRSPHRQAQWTASALSAYMSSMTSFVFDLVLILVIHKNIRKATIDMIIRPADSVVTKISTNADVTLGKNLAEPLSKYQLKVLLIVAARTGGIFLSTLFLLMKSGSLLVSFDSMPHSQAVHLGAYVLNIVLDTTIVYVLLAGLCRTEPLPLTMREFLIWAFQTNRACGSPILVAITFFYASFLVLFTELLLQQLS